MYVKIYNLPPLQFKIFYRIIFQRSLAAWLSKCFFYTIQEYIDLKKKHYLTFEMKISNYIYFDVIITKD